MSSPRPLRVPPPALGAVRDRPHPLAFGTNLALVVHAGFALLLLTGATEVAHRYLFPVSHLVACCVLVGSHVMLHQHPSTLSRSEFPGQEHLGPFAILLGHELKHLLPLVALHAIEAAWPPHPVGPTTAGMTLVTLAAAAGYYLVQRADNPYRISRADFREACGVGVGGGLVLHLVLLVGGA